MPYVGSIVGHWIKYNLVRNECIILEDGSLWEVSSLDRYKPSLWLKTDSISVLDSHSRLYPYKLLNHSSGDVVEARYLGKVLK